MTGKLEKVILRYLNQATELKTQTEITRGINGLDSYDLMENWLRVPAHRALVNLVKKGCVEKVQDEGAKALFEITPQGTKLIHKIDSQKRYIK